MQTVNILEAKNSLSKLVRTVESGKVPEVVLARNGHPVVRIVPLDSKPQGSLIGALRRRCDGLEDFNAADAEIEAMFLGEAE